ncbi:MAG: hypothetical protein EOL87_17230 [Spartobacteria bacterium]|nr:hypothetical protein [Spartobacteria bacterium]
MNDSTLLHRQVNPAWIQNGRVTSQAFKPTPKDKKQLSVYNGDLITAEDAWKHFTAQNLRSAGCLAVLKSECCSCKLDVLEDPETFLSHALIDFHMLESNRAIERAAKKLKLFAIKRDWTYIAESLS